MKHMPKINGPTPSELDRSRNRNRKPKSAPSSWTKKQIEQFLNREILAEQKDYRKRALENVSVARKKARKGLSNSAREATIEATYWFGLEENCSELLFSLLDRLDLCFEKGK